MALEVEFVLLEPGHIELLSGGTTLKLTGNVFLVVTDDLCDDIGRRDTLGSLGYQELSCFLAWPVDIIGLRRGVWLVVMGNIVDVVLLQELGSDNPRCILDNLVNPFAVTEGLSTLLISQYRETLALVGIYIVRYTNNEGCIRKSLLGLFQLSHVSQME